MGRTLKKPMKLFKTTLAQFTLTLSIITLFCPSVTANTHLNQKVAKKIHQTALHSNLGYKILESLTVEVGPRLPGSIKINKQLIGQ